MSHKVLISDNMSPKAKEILEKAGIQADVKTGLAPDEIKKVIGDYDGLVVRSATKVTSDIIEEGRKLKVIGRAGMGVDNIDVSAATRRGIVVMNTPGGNSLAAAEHAIALMMALARHIPQADLSVKSGKWEKNKFIGVELANKTLGIIGLGNIGKIVARRAIGLEMKVIAYDPFVPQEKAAEIGVEMVDLDELFRRSDFISIHTPKTDETVGLINGKTIAKMKDGVRIINDSRGTAVVEKDLAEALKSGKVAGAALDVFAQEPPKDSPLLGLPNVIFTPHLGASTGEAQENVAVAIAKQIVDFLLRGTIVNAVNVPSVSGEMLKVLSPYLDLAEKLGSFHGQLISNPIKSVEITYSGQVLEYDIAPLTLSLLKGLFSQFHEHVNYVNARQIAEERGIAVREIKSTDPKDFVSLIELTTTTTARVRKVSGALFGKREPRIVEIDGVHLDATPSGWVLLVHNYDRPGTIGAFGTLLGKRSVNINRLQLGLPKSGGDVAISFINIDSQASEDVLEEMRKLENIISVKQVKFNA